MIRTFLLVARETAAGEDGLRVTAYIQKSWAAGDASKAAIAAPPCFPVAPVIKRFLTIVAMDDGASKSVGKEHIVQVCLRTALVVSHGSLVE